MSSWFGSGSSRSPSSPSPSPSSSSSDFSSPPPPSIASLPADFTAYTLTSTSTPPSSTYTATSASTVVASATSLSTTKTKLPQGRVDPNHLYDYINITNPGSGNYSMISPMESCIVKSALSGTMGAGMGFLLGLFMSSTDPTWVSDPDGKIREMSTRNQIKHSMKHMWTRSSGMAKNFGGIGLIFSAVECTIEKNRGVHDIWNVGAAGCITGAGLAFKAGPHAMALGCGGFAAFSVAIELFMTRDSS